MYMNLEYRICYYLPTYILRGFSKFYFYEVIKVTYFWKFLCDIGGMQNSQFYFTNVSKIHKIYKNLNKTYIANHGIMISNQ